MIHDRYRILRRKGEAETINESIVARATAKNPTGAKKLQELEEIRAMHLGVANLAAAEIKKVLA